MEGTTSMPNNSELRRLRTWIGNDLDRLAVAIADLAHWVHPVTSGSLCPDCQIGPDLGPDVECPFCRERFEQKRRDESLMAGAYDDGYDAGRRSREAEGTW